MLKKTKLTELENKIPDVSNLATKTVLTAVENKIPSVSSLVKQTDYNTNISEIEKKLTDHNHDKYITTPEFNTEAASVFNARLATGTVVNLPMSNLSTSVFRLAKFVFSTKLEVSTCVTFFRSVFVA